MSASRTALATSKKCLGNFRPDRRAADVLSFVRSYAAASACVRFAVAFERVRDDIGAVSAFVFERVRDETGKSIGDDCVAVLWRTSRLIT